ncbi:MAG: CmpA/NrtA family ABC transporter substrate-binding protein [Pseudomonadota bacterium]
MTAKLDIGYIPLVDAAPLLVAAEIGFAAEEGLEITLHREPSWSAIRDRLAFGQLHAAHMLAPIPIAMSMGLGGLPLPVDALQVLSVNGTVIGVSRPLAARMRERGVPSDIMAAAAVGRALIEACPRPLKIGVPFPFSMHAELLYYWLGALGLHAPQQLTVRTIPPPRMAEAMEAGEIDAFCVGEPWGSVAVEQGVADIVLPGCAIWRFAPEKVLAVSRSFRETEPDLIARLMRAVWRAGRWLGDPSHHMATAEILAQPRHLDVSPEILSRSLEGRLIVSAEGEVRRIPRFVEFAAGAAQFPWRSQALWIATRLSERLGADPADVARAARDVFRSDLYRANLGPIGADLPGASEKVEGSLDAETPVSSSLGRLFMGPDSFFDGRIFEPLPLS